MDISMARAAIESLYFDRATIIEYQHVVDPEDGSTNVEEVVVHDSVPCKVNHVLTGHTTDRDAGDDAILVSKLFMSPDIQIKAGSKIIVTRNGVSTLYKNSGEPARCMNHQEIKIELWEDRA